MAPIRAAGQFVGKHWQWVAGTVAIPVVVWVAKDTDAVKTAIKRVQGWLGLG